jgi:hypothetical protein
MADTFRITIRTGAIGGPVVATSDPITINDTSKSPPLTLSSSVGSLSEGLPVTITLLAPNLPNNTLVPYLIYGAGITLGDFAGLTSLRGNFRITGGRASLTLNLANDKKTESSETFYLKLTNTGNDETIQVSVADTSQEEGFLAEFYVTSPTAVVLEGQTAQFNVVAKNIEIGTVVPYKIVGISQEDISGTTQVEGVLTFGPGDSPDETKASISLPILEDFLDEGSETIILLLEPEFNYTLQVSSTITIQDRPKKALPSYSVVANKDTVIEGESVTFTLNTVNVSDGTIISWSIIPWKTNSLTLGDFDNLTSFSGNFPAIVNGSANVTILTKDDLVQELPEYFYLTIEDSLAASQIIRILDSGNTADIQDEIYSGNIIVKCLDSAILKANIGSTTSGISYWKDSSGLLSENMVIQGKTAFAKEEDLAFYQPFSYVIQSKVSIEEWREAVKPLLHPAGLAIFSEINNETLPSETLNLGVKSIEETDITSTEFKTIGDTEIDTSTTVYFGSNVTVDSLTLSYNL